jgi:hypothetical protein
MKQCPACGKKINEGAKFCQNCGAEIKEKTAGTATAAPAAGQAEKKGMDKKAVIIIAAVLLVAVAAFFAFGGWNYLFGKPQQPADMAADGTVQQIPMAQADQPQENMAQSSGAKKTPARQNVSSIEGRWEGTWNAGYGDTGFCSVSISKGNYVSVCYDSRSTGRVTMDRRGRITFEGPGTIWDCRLVNERGRALLKGNYTVKRIGTGTGSGSLRLYRVSDGKGRTMKQI